MPVFPSFNVPDLGPAGAKRRFYKIIKAVKEDVEGGASLTDALRKYPNVFDELFVNLIAAGEAGGILELYGTLCNYMEKAMKLKARSRGQ